MDTIKLTRKQYESIHRDFRGVWQNPEYPEYVGRRTVMTGSACHLAGVEWDGRTCLLIEGYGLEIV